MDSKVHRHQWPGRTFYVTVPQQKDGIAIITVDDAAITPSKTDVVTFHSGIRIQ